MYKSSTGKAPRSRFAVERVHGWLRPVAYGVSLLAILAASAPLLWSQARTIVFMQIADPQMGMFSDNHGSQQEIRNLSAVVDRANHIRPAFLVICGDLMNSSSSAEQLKSFREAIAGLKGVPLHLVPGNHDVGNNPTPQQLALYTQRFGPNYYEFHSGPLIGIVLNSMLIGDPAAPEQSERQFQWLQKTLKEASREKGRQIAIFQHKPFFVHSADEPNSYWNVPLTERARYLALFRRYGVTHVFAGHLHYPDYARDGKLEVIVAGATGKPLEHSVSGINLVQVSDKPQWTYHWFPLTALPSHLEPPW